MWYHVHGAWLRAEENVLTGKVVEAHQRRDGGLIAIAVRRDHWGGERHYFAVFGHAWHFRLVLARLGNATDTSDLFRSLESRPLHRLPMFLGKLSLLPHEPAACQTVDGAGVGNNSLFSRDPRHVMTE